MKSSLANVRTGFKLSELIAKALLLVLLSGCGHDDFSDLDAFITAEKAKPRTPIEPIPEVKVVEPFIFKPEGLRDPFLPMEHPDLIDSEDKSEGSGIKPDLNRPKEELEAFALDSLRMVGTVNTKVDLWGLIKASDGTVYRVRAGNYIGKNYGKIVRITNDKIEIMELISDKPGRWREQQQSLALTE